MAHSQDDQSLPSILRSLPSSPPLSPACWLQPPDAVPRLMPSAPPGEAYPRALQRGLQGGLLAGAASPSAAGLGRQRELKSSFHLLPTSPCRSDGKAAERLPALRHLPPRRRSKGAQLNACPWEPGGEGCGHGSYSGAPVPERAVGTSRKCWMAKPAKRL